jgi:hypothetical protein
VGREAEIDTIVEVTDGLASPSAVERVTALRKLLIPLERRDVRVVEGARLESEVREQRQATPRYLIAHSLSDLAAENDRSVCVGKPPYQSGF